jgi:uncharacterized membrane protein YjgN (DUF898 family)
VNEASSSEGQQAALSGDPAEPAAARPIVASLAASVEAPIAASVAASVEPPIDQPVAPPPPAALPFAFTGIASDYFRIWIVNLLLNLITLGLWSPWSKVRKRRYFYGHTWVAGANFEYHGDPWAILRGRLLAASAFAVYWFVDHLQPIAGPWLLLALLMAAPWIVARSLAFNAANSSHRGIRFAFDGNVTVIAKAIWPLFLWPFALWLTQRDPFDVIDAMWPYALAAGLVYLVLIAGYPYAMARVRRLTVAHSSWGRCRFTSGLSTGKVYAIYGIAALLGLIGLALMAAVGIAAFFIAKLFPFPDPGPEASAIASGAGAFVLYVVLVVTLMSYTRSRIGNLVFNTARLGEIARFKSTVSARRLARLYGGNLFAILFSAGLLIPWAVIRVARYRIESLAVIPDFPIDVVAAAVAGRPAAVGEELGEVFGFDLAL